MKKRPAKNAHRWDWFHYHRLRWCGLFALTVALVFGNCFAHLPTETRAKFGPFEVICESLGAATAGLTDTIGLTGHDASVAYEKEPPLVPLPFGVPQVADATKVPGDVQVLKRQGYWVGYSPSLRRPVWAAYAIPVDRILESIPDRPARFFRDEDVRSSPVHEDYTGSGYDRGHLAPNYAIATRYGVAAQKETFLLTNVAPQEPERPGEPRDGPAEHVERPRDREPAEGPRPPPPSMDVLRGDPVRLGTPPSPHQNSSPHASELTVTNTLLPQCGHVTQSPDADSNSSHDMR